MLITDVMVNFTVYNDYSISHTAFIELLYSNGSVYKVSPHGGVLLDQSIDDSTIRNYTIRVTSDLKRVGNWLFWFYTTLVT